MRIGIEAQRLFRPNKHGMEVVALEIIKALQRLDTKNEYVVFVKDDEDPCVVETNNFKLEVLPSKPYPYWEQVLLPKAVKKHGVDILHCTCNTGPRWAGVPTLLTLHDIIYLESINFSGSAYQNFGNLYRRWVVPSVARKAELIVTVSEFEKRTIQTKLGLDSESVDVIYNAKADHFKIYNPELVNEARKKYGLPQEYILFFGNTAPKKNTQRVLLAYCDYFRKSSAPLPLVMSDSSMSFVQDILKSEGQSDIIEKLVVLAHVSYSEIPLIYNAASLFLYPSLRESFGLPIVEAMACGVPVITSNTSSMPEIAGDAACIVDPYDTDDITSAIISVLSDKKLRENLIEKGLNRSAFFSWENAAKKLLKIYQKLGRQ